ALGADDLLGPAAEVEEDLGFGQVEVDRAPFPPPRREEAGERLGAFERLEEMSEVAPDLRVAIDERLADARIGEPRMAPHDGVVEGRAEQPAARLVFEPYRLHETVFAGLQATDAGRQLLGQHRDHT